MLRSQVSIAEEVGPAVGVVRKEAGSLTHEATSVNSIIDIAAATTKDLTDWTAEQVWEEDSVAARCRCHADVVNVGIR